MDLGIPPFLIKIVLESNSLKPTMLVGRLGGQPPQLSGKLPQTSRGRMSESWLAKFPIPVPRHPIIIIIIVIIIILMIIIIIIILIVLIVIVIVTMILVLMLILILIPSSSSRADRGVEQWAFAPAAGIYHITITITLVISVVLV